MTAPSLLLVATHVHHFSTFFTVHHHRSPPPHVSRPLVALQATFLFSPFQNRAAQSSSSSPRSRQPATTDPPWPTAPSRRLLLPPRRPPFPSPSYCRPKATLLPMPAGKPIAPFLLSHDAFHPWMPALSSFPLPVEDANTRPRYRRRRLRLTLMPPTTGSATAMTKAMAIVPPTEGAQSAAVGSTMADHPSSSLPSRSHLLPPIRNGRPPSTADCCFHADCQSFTHTSRLSTC